MIRHVKLTILGSGTSAGVPVIGCDCATCTSADPRDSRLRTSASLTFTDSVGTDRVILLDASPDLRQQALKHKLTRCDAILFTHNHVDHTFGLDEVRRFNAVMQAPIDIFAERHTMEHLQRVYRHIFDRANNVNDSFVATLIPHLIDPARPIDLFGLRATPVRMLHGKLPILSYRFDAIDENGAMAQHQPAPLPIAYCTDVSSFPPEAWPRLRGLRTLVLDMLRFRHHPTHMTVDAALTAAARIAAEQTWFVHMTHDIRHAELDPNLPAGMALAYDGLEIGGAGCTAEPQRSQRGEIV
jgi:phosphoribosyl 1,2-cyclic phosphate phosphodiesterase